MAKGGYANDYVTTKLYLFLQKQKKTKNILKNLTIPKAVVGEMMKNDFFSQWLGIEVLEVTEGTCRLKMTVKKDMLNGFGIAHGGIAFALADSALAFAANSRNKKSLVLDANISFLAPVKEGEQIFASAEEVNLTNRTGIYNISVTNQDDKLIAVFKGIVFRKSENWFPDEE